MKEFRQRLILTLALLVCSCDFPRDVNTGQKIRYVAIGDSYSVGEGARPEEAWPILLTGHLNREGFPVHLAALPARTGWTTVDVLESELPVFIKAKPDFATLQIGVNDWVQGADPEQFRTRLSRALNAMQKELADPRKILVVNIPDFSAAPAGNSYSGGRDITAGITKFNQIIQEEADARKLPVVDVFTLSQEMRTNRRLVAADGLHPSAEEYAIWEKAIYPEAVKLLGNSVISNQ